MKIRNTLTNEVVIVSLDQWQAIDHFQQTGRLAIIPNPYIWQFDAIVPNINTIINYHRCIAMYKLDPHIVRCGSWIIEPLRTRNE